MVNFWVHIQKDKNCKLVTICALPDTGATIHFVTENFEKRHGVTIVPDKENMIELKAAEGNAMKVTGITKLTLQLAGGGWSTTVALVYPFDYLNLCFCYG